MTSCFGCLSRVLAVVLCVGILLAAVWLFARSSGTLSNPLPGAAGTAAPVVAAVASPGPTPEADASASAQRKLNAVEQAVRAAPHGSQKPVSVTLTEAEVNALADPMLQSAKSFPLQNPHVAISGGLVTVDGRMPVGNGSVPVAATATAQVNAGIPHLVLQDARVAGLPAPQTMVDQLSSEVDNRFRLTGTDVPFLVQSVTLGDHSVTVAGVTK